MNKTVAIRHEDKYLMERRAAITPKQAEKLVKQGFRVLVEASEKRVFKADKYLAAGAELVVDISESPVVFGVKEMPLDIFEEGKTYVFFSHTIKGQVYNRPLLKKMIEKKVNLIEYERILDDDGRRLIFFGRFAGLAGMINSLWSLGIRMRTKGVTSLFDSMRQAHTYNNLDEAKATIRNIAQRITTEGLSPQLSPLVVGITGYGNVSKGAQEILDLFPTIEITPEELLQLRASREYSRNHVYKVIFKEEHIAARKDGSAFDLQDYYKHPENYVSAFEKYIPHINVLMNCMYWDDRYPRIVTKNYLRQMYRIKEPHLKVIGDVTCDPNGSIEATHAGTYIEDPIFVYNPLTDTYKMGCEGQGVLIMAVDILPSELPRDASEAFSYALSDFIPDIVKCDYSVSYDKLALPMPIKRALILHNGKLTNDYKYMDKFL